MKSPVETHVLAATALSYLCTSIYYIGSSVTGTSWRKCKVWYVHKGLPYKSFVWQAPDWQSEGNSLLPCCWCGGTKYLTAPLDHSVITSTPFHYSIIISPYLIFTASLIPLPFSPHYQITCHRSPTPIGVITLLSITIFVPSFAATGKKNEKSRNLSFALVDPMHARSENSSTKSTTHPCNPLQPLPIPWASYSFCSAPIRDSCVIVETIPF